MFPSRTTRLIGRQFEISGGGYRQHFATREKYQDAGLLSLRE
jgi:hypothetical protein